MTKRIKRQLIQLVGRNLLARQDKLPRRSIRLIPTYIYLVRLSIGLDIHRRQTLCNLIHRDIVDVVKRLLASIYITPNDSDNAFRTGVVLEVSISRRITGRSHLALTYRDKGIDIHRVGHHTDRSKCLGRRRSTTQIECYLLVSQRVNRRKSDPRVVTPILGQRHTRRTAMRIGRN